MPSDVFSSNFFTRCYQLQQPSAAEIFLIHYQKRQKITLKQTLLWAEPNHMITKSAARTPDTQQGFVTLSVLFPPSPKGEAAGNKNTAQKSIFSQLFLDTFWWRSWWGVRAVGSAVGTSTMLQLHTEQALCGSNDQTQCLCASESFTVSPKIIGKLFVTQTTSEVAKLWMWSF